MQSLSNVALVDLEMLLSELRRVGISKPLVIESPLIYTKTLKESGYLKHFPWQVLSTSNKKIMLKPSACLSVYEKLANTEIDEIEESLILTPVYRTESKAKTTKDRLNAFWMLEYVLVGEIDAVNSRAKMLSEAIPGFFSSLSIDVKSEYATDAFFLDESKGSRLLQKMKQLKTEFVEHKTGVSLASLNKHEDYFTNKYGISTVSGRAHSLCFALGVDRILNSIKGLT